MIKLQPWLDKIISACLVFAHGDGGDDPQEELCPAPDTAADEILPVSPPLTLKIYRLAKVPAYIREPQRHHIELKLARQRALNDCRTMQRRLEILARSNHKNVQDRTMIRNEATSYGLVLGLRLLYIQLLRTINDADGTLLKETHDVRKTIHNLAG